MKRGLLALSLAYILSQFYRAFLPVLAPVLATEIGASPDDLARASGIWFLIFAVMQIPVGMSLDSVGPRRTASALFILGGAGGALVFGLAQSPLHVTIAMALIGIGCSPVLMAAYYIIARTYSAAAFGTLAGGMIGFGSIGNLAGSAPMAWSIEALGWRPTMLVLAAVSLVVGLALMAMIRDPERIETEEKGSILTLLKIPILWPIFIVMLVNYAPAASLRGLWAGPYLGDVFGADVGTIGRATFIMAIAMIIGNFAFGPLERLFGTRKWVVFGGISMGAMALAVLWLYPAQSLWLSTVLLALVGISGSTFAVIIGHGKSFFPAHLMGRGVTLMNLFGIGGAGIMQFATGPIYRGALTDVASDAYVAIFAVFTIMTAAGLVAYLFSQDRFN
ncbi:MAG: MFS transporter [Yoonia sp.]|nr:MFS transporter [Yoonia sp.]